MYPVSAQFLAAIRSGHRIVSTVTFRNPFTGVMTDLPKLTGSQVTVDVTAAARRTLTLVCPPQQSLFDVLSVPGGEITVTQGVRYIDRSIETIPIGVFCLTEQSLGYRPDGQLQITAPDRWFRIQQSRFALSRSSIASNMGWQEIKRLVEGAWPNLAFPFPGWAPGSPDVSATTKVGSILWTDGSRENAITGIATPNALEVFFTADGHADLRPVPQLDANTPSVWTVDASASGVFMDGERKVDLSRFRNTIIVTTSATDIILSPVEVKNTHDPAVDPLSTLGPLGNVPGYYSSPAIRTTAQATAAGKTLLQKDLSNAQQISLTGLPNPAIDGWDVIDVAYPRGDTGQRPTDRQMLESGTIPLTADTAQTLTLRSTRPTTDDTT